MPPERQGADNVEAYKLHLMGRQHWNKATREGFEAAVADFSGAVALAPGYAPPFAGLADAYTWLWILGLAPASDVVPKAREAAVEALRLDPEPSSIKAISFSGLELVNRGQFSDALVFLCDPTRGSGIC